MDPPKIILPDSEVDIKTLDKSVINKWRWEWLDYTIQLDLGGGQLVSLINLSIQFPENCLGRVLSSECGLVLDLRTSWWIISKNPSRSFRGFNSV